MRQTSTCHRVDKYAGPRTSSHRVANTTPQIDGSRAASRLAIYPAERLTNIERARPIENHPYPQSIAARPSESVRHQTVFVKAADGTRLHMHLWSTVEMPAKRPIALLVHGIGLHGAPYASIAPGFVRAEIPLICPDLRGHGRSGGVRGLSHEKTLLADLTTIVESINQRFPDAPVVLLGESMGGLIAADFAVSAQDRFAGLVLLAPAFRVHRSRIRFINPLKPINIDDDLDDSSHSEGFKAAKQNDKLAHHEVAAAYLLQIAKMQTQWPRAAKGLRLPLMLHVAGQDVINDGPPMLSALDMAATPDAGKTVKRWPQSRHTLFWDPATPQVVESITQWINGLPH